VLSDVDEDLVRAIAADHIFVEAEERGVGYIDKQPICVYLDCTRRVAIPRNGPRSPVSCGVIQAELGVSGKGALIASPGKATSWSARHGGTAEDEVPDGPHRHRAAVRVTDRRHLQRPGRTSSWSNDLCMEGTFLKRCCAQSPAVRAQHLRLRVPVRTGRTGVAREALASVKVNLHSRYLIDDEETATVARKRRRGGPQGEA
jgi:hypothetical protein